MCLVEERDCQTLPSPGGGGRGECGQRQKRLAPYNGIIGRLSNLTLMESQAEESNTLFFANDPNTSVSVQVYHCDSPCTGCS